MVATTAFGLSYDREKKNRQSGIVQYEIDIMRAVGGGEAATVDLLPFLPGFELATSR